MFPLPEPTRARVAAVLMAVLTALTVAVPLLDLGRDPGALAFTDADHTPGYVDHHHGVCVQHSAAAWTPASGAELPSERLVRQDDAPLPVVVHPIAATLTAHHSRAPPLI